MDRPFVRTAWSLAICFVGIMLTAGCALLPSIAYMIKPEDVPAEFDALAGQRVAVICRAASLNYADPTVGREVSVRVGQLLAKHCKKVQIIDERELADWVDKHDWHDFREVGKALKADMVVGIDLERCELKQGSTLLQGNADVKIAVYDIKKNMRVWEKRPETIRFPNMPISSSDRREDDFRRQFLSVLSERIAQHFYAHDSRVNFASDSTVLK